MPMYIGGIDPLKLIEGILNKLVEENIITKEEAMKLINDAKAPSLEE